MAERTRQLERERGFADTGNCCLHGFLAENPLRIHPRHRTFFSTEVAGDFTATVTLAGDFTALYDQAGLMLRIDERSWLKVGVEYSDGALQLISRRKSARSCSQASGSTVLGSGPPCLYCHSTASRPSAGRRAAVWGRNDEIFGPAGAVAFRHDVTKARVELLDGGHFVLESHLDEVADVILDWRSGF